MKNSEKVNVSGVLFYRERIALMPRSQISVTVEDISKQDVASLIIGKQEFETKGEQVPIPFKVRCEADLIHKKNRYSVRASIKTPDGKLLFISDKVYPVLTNDTPTENIDVLLVSAKM